MKSFTVKGLTNCGLVINGEGNKILSFIADSKTMCQVIDTATFEEFTTKEEAKTRALKIEPDCRDTDLFPDTEQTNNDI